MQPASVNRTAQHSGHLTSPRFTFSIVVLRKAPVSRQVHASDNTLGLHETYPKNPQRLR